MRDSKTQHAIRTIFSTYTILFLGFSLTDPHLTSVLETVKGLCNGMPVDHYLLIPERDRLTIESLERRFGITAIEYIASAPDHPEVQTFVAGIFAATEGPATASPSSDVEVLIKQLDDQLGRRRKAISFDGKGERNLRITIETVAATKLELQKEILAVAGALSVCPKTVETVWCQLIQRTTADESYGGESPSVVQFEISSSTLRALAKTSQNAQSLRTAFEQMKFYRLDEIGSGVPRRTLIEMDFIGSGL